MKRFGCILFTIGLATAAWAQNDYDARILSYEGLDRTCDGSLTPVLRIVNDGAAPMATCVIDIWKNGLADDSFNWILAQPAIQGEVRQPALPTMDGLQPGDELEFRIISVNGELDQEADGNVITKEVQGESAVAGAYLVKVEVRTDDAPEETTWTVKNALGQVVASGGPYSTPGVLEQEWLELDPGACYAFKLEGTDGEDPQRNLEGSLKVIALGEEVFSVEGDAFTDGFEDALRPAANGCATTRLTTADDPVPSCLTNVYLDGSSTIQARPVPGADRYQFRFAWGNYVRLIAVPVPELVLNPWVTLPLKPGRFYTVRVRVSFDGGASYCPYGESCWIRTLYPPAVQVRHFDPQEDIGTPAMVLFPNPSDGGAVELLLDVPSPWEGQGLLELHDLSGRSVHREVLPLAAGRTGHVLRPAAALAPGMYAVTLSGQDFRLSQRLMVR